MSNTETKFCKDCKFFKVRALDDCCENPVFLKQINVITGEIIPNRCSDLRNKTRIENYSFGLCGPEAQHYEKRLSWWEKLWN